MAGLIGCGAKSTETYDVTGVVRAIDAAQGQVKIEHEEIPGFMPAMTMNFDVTPPSLIEGIEPGARVRFTLERAATTLRVTQIEVLGHDPPAFVGGGMGGIPERDVAPAFDLIDEDGEALTLSDLHGKAVLIDFIFTRCMGPCPILTSIHVTLQRQLPADVASRTHFVSITVDPERDTPSDLRQYAKTRGADLRSWSFLTGEPETVEGVLERYMIGSYRSPDGTLNHLVATFLIDPEGRIARRYLGLEHPPEKILRDLKEILS
jgi:protein SCO1/2